MTAPAETPPPISQTSSFWNKSMVTNLIALGLTVAGYISPAPWQQPLFNVGLFALSGALTNWLAIHMLFEKVPGLYGSGVIPARFEEFKTGIHGLVMNQFFTLENIARFLKGSGPSGSSPMNLEPLVETLDLDPAFESLKEAILESKFGGALAMFGGAKALEPIRPKFVDRMRSSLRAMVVTDDFQERLQALLAGPAGSSAQTELLDRVSTIVTKRLDELTPKMVKDIIQDMIRKHLGWLVVWGGVCGGLIGLIASLLGMESG